MVDGQIDGLIVDGWMLDRAISLNFVDFAVLLSFLIPLFEDFFI